MFQIIQLTKRSCIPSSYFHKDVDLESALTLILNRKFHNQVIYNAGLFVLVTSIENYQVQPAIMNKADIFVDVTFRCMVFTLVGGEILVARIHECVPQGLTLNLMNFYKTIRIEPNYFPTPSKYEHNGKRWMWMNKIGIEEYCFPINNHDEVRLKILETKFQRFSLINKERFVEPMVSYGTIKRELLGPVMWWE